MEIEIYIYRKLNIQVNPRTRFIAEAHSRIKNVFENEEHSGYF